MNELIERAIQSAEARIYKLEQGKKRNHTVRHQEKAENQAELQRVTVEALKGYEELLQYRAIGTVEECREAVGKQNRH